MTLTFNFSSKFNFIWCLISFVRGVNCSNNKINSTYNNINNDDNDDDNNRQVRSSGVTGAPRCERKLLRL